MAHGKDKRVKVKSVNLSLIDAIVHVLSKKSPVILCTRIFACTIKMTSGKLISVKINLRFLWPYDKDVFVNYFDII